MIIEASKMTANGYCHQCNKPRRVIECTIAGWAFAFWLCPDCLQALTTLAMRAPQIENQGGV